MAGTAAILVTQVCPPNLLEEVTPVRVRRETLQKRRWRAVAGDGTELAIDLVEPARDGDLISGGGRQFVLVQEAEQVVAIPLPGDRKMAAKIGWYLGNRHLPIEVREDEMLVERFPTLTDSLDRIGIGYSLRTDVLRCRAHSSGHRH